MITNTAPIDCIPVTADADGNLIGSIKLCYDPNTGSIRIQGDGASCVITLAQNAINISITADAALTLNLDGLPDTDPHVNGRVWNNAGVLTVSAG